MSDVSNVAAQIMEHLCNCPEHGYSQPGRQGTSGTCAVATDAGTAYVTRGDRDCSSAVINAWKQALAMCGIAAALEATYTGNMRSGFLATGLFTWEPMSFTAQRGDIYLNESSHTAMCVDDGSGPYGYDALAEFSLAETGGIDGEPGDQTGSESSIHAYYDYPWDGILHYIGGNPQPQQQGTRYRVKTNEFGWHEWMEGLRDTGGSADDFAGSEGCLIYGFEVEGHGFRIIRCDGSESTDSQGNENSPICGIEIMGDVDYQVRWLDINGQNPEWGKWEHGSDDNGAGKDCYHPLDMIRVK